MTEPERDREVARALQTVDVPEHREGFWESLETEVTPLTRRNRGRFLAIAAALLVVVSVASVLAARGGGTRVDTDGTPKPNATTPPTAVVPTDGADVAVREWLTALGEGDIDRAVELTGPKTERYITSLGGNLRGFLTEAQEGYGAWAASPDLSTTEVELPISSQQITIVVVSGTWTGEGETEFRHDALPVIRTDKGWQVEPSAFRSDTGGRLEIDESDTAVIATAPGSGGFFFSLNDGEVKGVAGETNGASRRATFSLAGLPKQTHLLVVAYIDGETVTALATTIKR